MSDAINVRILAEGTKVILVSGLEAEIISNPNDGVWLFVRHADAEEEMVFAQDVIEVLGVG